MDANSAQEGLLKTIPLPRDLTSRFRKGTPRSRYGCITCKTRRVKCDETKPECRKCHRSGRNCEYASLLSKRSNLVIPVPQLLFIPYQPSTDISGSYAERRSFHYVQAKNLTETFGKCEIDLWDSIMPLYSHHYLPLRTSLFALGAVFEVYENKIMINDRTPIDLGSLEKHPFSQYTKAVTEIIQSLRSTTERDNNDRKAILSSCLIFTWIEIMLGNLDTAKLHLDSGINIISQIVAESKGNMGQIDTDDVYGSLYRSFLRLKFQITVGLDASPKLDDGLSRTSPIPSPPDKVRVPATVRTSQQTTQDPSFELAWTLNGRRRQLEQLRKADEATNRKPVHAVREEDRRRSLTFVYIKLSRVMLSLMTEARGSGAGTVLFSRYLEVVEIIEDIYTRKKQMPPTPVSLDFGIIPPLVFISKWCKDVNIRLRAYKMLKGGLWREGLLYRDDMLASVEQHY